MSQSSGFCGTYNFCKHLKLSVNASRLRLAETDPAERLSPARYVPEALSDLLAPRREPLGSVHSSIRLGLDQPGRVVRVGREPPDFVDDLFERGLLRCLVNGEIGLIGAVGSDAV